MKLQDQMREKIRLQGKSKKTFQTYWHWCERYLKFLRNRNGEWVHPATVGRESIETYLTHLANKEHVSKTTQNVALQALLYLYKQVLGVQIENVNAMRSQRPQTVREVIDVSEVQRLFDHLDGIALLAAQMMYGCGLRIGDLIALRVKDLSFERRQITVRCAKGDKWRYTSFPEVLHQAVARQIESVRVVHRYDETDNPNGVSLPGAYRRKCPSAARTFGWYWLFPSDVLSRDEHGVLCRHHRDPSNIGRQIKNAVEKAGLDKRVTSHVLRHCYATHSHEQGVPLRTLQQLLGHVDIRTTETYVHADKNGVTASKSPIEHLLANPRETAAHKAKEAATPTLRLFVG